VGLTNKVATLERTSMTDIKLSPMEQTPAYRGSGYEDQYAYVITKVHNRNDDEYIDDVGRRQLLKKVDGSWVDIG